MSRTLLPAALLSALLILSAAVRADTAADSLSGDWTGTLHSGSETKPFGLRFSHAGTEPLAVAFTLPEGKLADLGPAYVTLQDDGYKADVMYFHMRFSPSADGKHLTGSLSFDGNVLPFELARGKLPPLPAASPPGRTATPAWTFKTGGPIWGSPAAAEGSVYVGSSDGMVYALDEKSGALRWQYQTGAPVHGSPTLQGAALYVLSDDGFLYKLDRGAGKLLWRFDTHGGTVKRAGYDRLASRAVVASGLVYVGSADGRLYAIDDTIGAEKWHFETAGPIRGGPAVAEGRVFFGSDDGNLYALDAASGARLWQYDTLKPVVTTPLVAGGLVYAGSRSANLYAFDVATGRVKWRKFYWVSWVESSARARDGIIYVGSSDYGCVFALDATDGHERWRYDTGGEAWPDPAVTERYVYTGSVGYADFGRAAGFYALDRASGKELWRFPITVAAPPLGAGVNSSPVVDGGKVYFGTLDGHFYAFPEDGGAG